VLGSQVDELSQAVTAATDWRNTAAGVGISLTQINWVFPDGRSVVFSWDVDNNEWQIQASA
jgi:hypothetical protein